MRNNRLSDKIKIVNAVVPSAGGAGAMTAVAYAAEAVVI